MILIKIFIFIFFALFTIWASNYDPKLHHQAYYIFHKKRKEPNQILNIILIVFILFGNGIMVYFIPDEFTKISLGEILGIIIVMLTTLFRSHINNKYE